MTAADLRAYVSAPESDAEFVGACWDEAEFLVLAYLGDATGVGLTAGWIEDPDNPGYLIYSAGAAPGAPISVPAAIIRRACLEVGSELFHRRQAPNGISQFASPDGAAVRVARDPLVGAYPILAPYMGVGFA